MLMNLIKRLFYPILAVAVLLLCGCFNTKYYEGVVSKIDDTTWIPTYLFGYEGTDVPSTSSDNLEAFLHFANRGYGRLVISGKAGVNNFTGSMDLRDDKSVVFALLASTLKIGKHYAYEAKFLSALRSVQFMEISGNEMQLYRDENGKRILIMKLKKMP